MRRWVRRRSTACCGLTLVELLVAAVLASMLMVSVLGVIRVLAVRQQQLLAAQHYEAWQSRVSRLMRHDLSHARYYEWTPAELRLMGYMGTDFDSWRPTHRPSEVVYRIARIDGRTWLVREEVHLDVLSTNNRRTELVCAGVEEIRLRSPDKTRTGDLRSTVSAGSGDPRRAPEEVLLGVLNSSSAKDANQRSHGEVPGCLRLVLSRRGSPQPVVEVVHCR